MDVVVDTNVLISGSLWAGIPQHALKLMRDFDAILWFSKCTWSELEAVLQYPKIRRRIQAIGTSSETILGFLMPWVQFIEPELTIDWISNEPIDNELIAVALTVQVDSIVSGDRHLLGVRDLIQIPVLTPSLFVKRFM